MVVSLDSAVAALRDVVTRLDASSLTGHDAAGGVRQFAELERLAAAGRTVLAARVDETRVWEATGARSAAEWMASVAGTSVRDAIGVVQTSKSLPEQPSVDAGLRSGQLSVDKA